MPSSRCKYATLPAFLSSRFEKFLLLFVDGSRTVCEKTFHSDRDQRTEASVENWNFGLRLHLHHHHDVDNFFIIRFTQLMWTGLAKHKILIDISTFYNWFLYLWMEHAHFLHCFSLLQREIYIKHNYVEAYKVRVTIFHFRILLEFPWRWPQISPRQW